MTMSHEHEHKTAAPSSESQHFGIPSANGFEGWMLLQSTIGNRAVGRLVEASLQASREDVHRVSPDTQREIDAARSGGRGLDSATRAELTTALGQEPPDVRLHEGPAAARLAGGLRANAFTQGRDIFFGAGTGPSNGAARSTLAHEVTHAAQGRTSRGTVQLEGEPQGAGNTGSTDAPTELKPDRPSNDEELAAQWSNTVVKPAIEGKEKLDQKRPDYAAAHNTFSDVITTGRGITGGADPSIQGDMKFRLQQLATVAAGLEPYMGFKASMEQLEGMTNSSIAGLEALTTQIGTGGSQPTAGQ